MPKEPKIGAEYFSLNVDEDDATHDWSIYRIRSIQNRKPRFGGRPGLITVRYVYAILVADWTYGKRSTKSGDYGWLPNIPQWCRHKWRVTDEPSGIFKTKKAAIKRELDRYKDYVQDDLDNPDMLPKILTKLENMLKRA